MLKYYNELDQENKLEIYLPFSFEKDLFSIPNCYYINSMGLLYNCFGKEGHKESNLLYTYNNIKDSFMGKKYASLNSNNTIKLDRLLKYEIENYNRIINTNSITEFDVLHYIHLNFCDLKNPLVFDLVLGILTSKIILLEKFIQLQNDSKDKINDLNKIISLSSDDLNDILVRYCGFHKIESQKEKTITTSSLNINMFNNYLENGWNIDVIPPIDINNNIDNSIYNTLVLEKYLKDNEEYSDKIKTLSLYKSSNLNK